MPSLQTARRVANAKNNGAKTIGQIYKEQSDFLMEQTFFNDIQSKVCYIYDYFHDDQPDKNVGMTYENTTKTKIDAKFIVKSYQSMDKDQVEYYLQFKPSQQTEFVEGDDLYYFETDYIKRYGSEDFVGHFVDIPDDKGIYHKWLICRKEPANQFVKYLILPCSYQLKWSLLALSNAACNSDINVTITPLSLNKVFVPPSLYITFSKKMRKASSSSNIVSSTRLSL